VGDLLSVMWNFNPNYSTVRKNYVLLPFGRSCLRLEHYRFAFCHYSVHLVENGDNKDLRNRSYGHSPAPYPKARFLILGTSILASWYIKWLWQRFSANTTSVFLCQYNSTDALYTLIHASSTLYDLTSDVLKKSLRVCQYCHFLHGGFTHQKHRH